MPGFGDLPSELVIKVAALLEKDDLCSLRLTSRYVEQHAIDHWATACFEKVFILPTKHALDKLHEISKHEKVRKAIRWIYIISTVYGTNDQNNSWERYAPMILPCEEEGTEHDVPHPNPTEIWMDCANENVKLLRSGEFERLLRDAITALPSLFFISVGTNTNLHKSHAWWGRSELIAKAGKEPCPTMNSCGKFYFACPSIQTRVCSIVLDICSLHQVNITQLELYHFDPYRIAAFKTPRSTISDCFNHLQVLTVHVELEDCRSQIYYEDLFRFVGALPDIQELSVYSDHAFPKPVYSGGIAASLVTFSIISTKVYPPYLVDFLSSSAATLKSLSVTLYEGDLNNDLTCSEWAKTMRFLRDKFSLEYLLLGGSGGFPQDLVASDSKGKDAVITQLNGLIEWLEGDEGSHDR